MNRRRYLIALCSTGVLATSGCSAVGSEQTLSNPTMDTESSRQKSLNFNSEGEKLAHFNVNTRLEAGVIVVLTEFWHQEKKPIEFIRLEVWMPQVASEPPADVTVSNVEGETRGPVSLDVSRSDESTKTLIEMSNVEESLQQTIDILAFVVEPKTEDATKLNIDATIKLAEEGFLNDGYTLEGELQFSVPELTEQ